MLKTKTAGKFARLIERLLVMYGDGQGGKCSHRYLARIIDPEAAPLAEPANAVGDWLRGVRIPYGKYFNRVAELYQLTPAELRRYLDNDPDFIRVADYDDSEVDLCEQAIDSLVAGDKLTREQKFAVEDNIDNFSIQKLKQLQEQLQPKIEEMIQDPNLLYLIRMNNQINNQIAKKLNSLAQEDLF